MEKTIKITLLQGHNAAYKIIAIDENGNCIHSHESSTQRVSPTFYAWLRGEQGLQGLTYVGIDKQVVVEKEKLKLIYADDTSKQVDNRVESSGNKDIPSSVEKAPIVRNESAKSK